jgi:phenylacetate-CoA ligase
MVKLRGINVFPTAIGALLDRIDGLVGEYVCQVVRGDGREELVVKTEVTVPDLVNDDRLREQVSAILRQALNVSVIIELVDPGATAELSEINRRQKPIRLLPTVSK